MKQLTHHTLLALTLTGLLSCAGTKVEPTTEPDIPLKIPSTTTNFPTNNPYHTNYSTPNLNAPLVLHASRRQGNQLATQFSWARTLWIHQLTWLGGVKNNSGLLDGTAQFILRVYGYDTNKLENEYLVEAKASLLGEKDGFYIYEFFYADANLFTLPAGNYFLAIVDPETEGMGFSWAEFAAPNPTETQDNTLSRMSDKGIWTPRFPANHHYGPMFLKLEGGKVTLSQ